MTRTYSLLILVPFLLVLGSCCPAWSADGEAPALLEQSVLNGAASAPCPCGHHHDSATTGVGGRHGCPNDGGNCSPHGIVGRARGALHGKQLTLDPWCHADGVAAQKSAAMSWHAGYYNTQYGAPVALVVPPTARMQTRWGWGVCQSTMSPIYHQFERPYPGPVLFDPATGQGANPLLPTPRWPSHTDQFGVYYARGPW